MAVGTITTTMINIGFEQPKYLKKVSFTNTADGSGVWATASLTDLYGFIAKVVVKDAGTNPNATFSLLLGETGASNNTYFFGACSGIDFTGGNSDFVAIPGQTASSVTTPIPVLLNGNYDLATSSSNTAASAAYSVDIYLVDTI